MKRMTLLCWFYGKSGETRRYDIYGIVSTGEGIGFELKDMNNKEPGETNWMKIEMSWETIKGLKKHIKRIKKMNKGGV